MASEIKSDKLSPSTGTALQIGDASDTITIPTGATFTITDGLGVAGGGTGLTGFTAGDVLYATGTTTLAKLAKGTAEQVLAMNSGATAPDWGSVDLTVLPTITVGKGGTNLTSFTAGDVLYATGSTTLAKLAKGSASDVLTMNSGATAPEWAAAAGGGKINQVIVGTYADRFESSTTDTWEDPGLSASITPSATDSRIWIMINLGCVGGGAANSPSIGTRIYRSGSGVTDGEIGVGSASGYSGFSLRGASFGEEYNTTSATYLGYPLGGLSWTDTTHNTTAALTYKLQMVNACANDYVLNGVHATGTGESYPATVSTVTLWEILA